MKRLKIVFVTLFAVLIMIGIMSITVHAATWKTGYIQTDLNIRKKPSINSKILDTYSCNTKVRYKDCKSKNWVKIKYNDGIAYCWKSYIGSNKKQLASYTSYSIPTYSSFKSWMSYTAITSTGSAQYKLQHGYAYTGDYGIRMVGDRYCVAIGTFSGASIGTKIDIVLENGVVIPAVLSDWKANCDTDANNMITYNGCASEFLIDYYSLNASARRMGDMSYCRDDWQSRVVEIRVYKETVW